MLRNKTKMQIKKERRKNEVRKKLAENIVSTNFDNSNILYVFNRLNQF